MIDPHEYELTDEEHEALLLMCGHAIAPPLSAAALAVLNAARQYEINPECYSREIAATTLRTAALYCKRDRIQLMSIADELEQV